MKKVEIQVEETTRYEDEIVVIQPEKMTDEEFEQILDVAERRNRSTNSGAKELAYDLKRLGLKIESQTFNFPDSPRSSELEIINVRDIN